MMQLSLRSVSYEVDRTCAVKLTISNLAKYKDVFSVPAMDVIDGLPVRADGAAVEELEYHNPDID